MGIALAVSAWFAFFGDSNTEMTISEPVARPVPQSNAVRRGNSGFPNENRIPKKDASEPAILALQSRDNLLERSTSGNVPPNLFASHSWTPPPSPSKPAPPPPPMAPALPFTYLGKKIEDGKWEVYLARGEQTYIAHPQTMIDNTYRIEKVDPPTLILTYLPLNQAQSLSIGGVD